MSKEFETRILEIDQEAIEKKLIELGAKKSREILFKRTNFDFPDNRLAKDRGFIRVRDDGEKVMMAYKCHPVDDAGEFSIDCTEIEFEVEDMHKPEQMLLALGLERKRYVENTRISYQLDDITFDIDHWPLIKPFLEIEAPTKERVMEAVALLGYSEDDTFQGHAGDIYEKIGIDWKPIKELTFDLEK